LLPLLQVHELAARLQQQHGLQGMRVHYTAKRGFYFILGAAGGCGGGRGGGRQKQKHPRDMEEDEEGSESQLQMQEHPGGGGASNMAAGGRGRGCGCGGSGAVKVPAGFAVLQHCGRTAQVTTNELNALNSRLRDARNDCMVLIEQVRAFRQTGHSLQRCAGAAAAGCLGPSLCLPQT
jgi:hypothetical protein